MENLTKVSKILLFLSVICFVLWVGSYFVKLASIYGMFEPNTFELKSVFIEGNTTSLFYLLVPIFVTNLCTYYGFVMFFILFILLGKVKLKKEGWLFISTILVLVTIPFEVYLTTIDWNVISIILKTPFEKDLIFQMIVKRMSILSSFPVIEFFLYIAVLFLFIFRPLRQVLHEN